VTAKLETTLHEISPRWTRPATPAASLLIHGAVFWLWVALFINALRPGGAFTWSIGIVYIFYDSFLLTFTFWQTLPLARAPAPEPAPVSRPSLAVIIAAYNEAPVLATTIAALLAQTDPPEDIILADDGSIDGTGELLRNQYGLPMPDLGEITPGPGLRWLRAPHGGKASALNRALAHLTTELFLTVDADTKLAPDAVAAMRNAFAATPGLVAATGVLSPACDSTISGRVFEWFQNYEYIRNFLGRYAWSRMDSLLLISGAFAGFRRDAVMTVGGFDPDCMVEDYELIHRLRRYGYDNGLNWHSTALGAARGRTSAPATLPAFLRQRRRWFGGFLQTQLWYRDMVGAAKYRRLGMFMLPVKAIDTMQPIYGLCAFALLIWYFCTGRIGVLIPAGGFIGAKILIDLAFHAWSIKLYRNWAGSQAPANMPLAILAAIIEPFSFQLLRHAGAAWGWLFFLTGRRGWGVQRRTAPAE